jgi:TolA-binding protein
MKRLFVWLVIVSVWGWAEPSVYSGAYSSDKRIKRNQSAIYKLRQQVAQLREEIEGLRTIIEGLNRTVGELQQKQGGNGNKKVLEDIANLIDKINQTYVSKTELRQALAQKNIAPKAASKPTKPTPEKSVSGTPVSRLEKASSSALYSRGVRLVNKKRYTEAKKRFDILAKRGYKKASTHFYLGEIAYRTGHYTVAVDEYKQSAEYNDNAAYMDRLLLHTGLALEKSGDPEQAQRFFQAIVDGYPDTASAKIAKKHLK